MAEWKGDEGRLGQLCQLFQLASSPDNHTQQQVMQTLNQFSQLPDFNMYLVTVFAKMGNQDEIVRQRAGLLLKTNLSRAQPGSLAPEVAQYVQALALQSLADSRQVIRHTAGTVITTIVLKAGIAASRQTLDKLAECLDQPNADIVEGSFNALNKICEDGMTMLKQMWDEPDQQTQHFVSWSAERLLPKVLQYASPQAPLHARRNAIECLNHFALNYAFNEPRLQAFFPFSAKYMEVLGVLANDQDTNVLKEVCKGFVCVVENQWQCLANDKGTSQVVLQYMLKASQHPEYAVRVEALEVWTPCMNSPFFLELIWAMQNDLIPVLLQNMVYSQADYMGMEHAMVEDDNSAVPDAAQDIKPRCHKETGDEDDEDKFQAGGAWGAEWTARKAAASSLDNLAATFRDQILGVTLPLIEAKLQDPNWEVQESGVLAVGAIAFGCSDGLEQYLPKVMDHILRLCEAPKPLLRSISCWTTARFSHWICMMAAHGSDQVLRTVLQKFLLRVLDKNKRVQEAACSAFATLEEEARHLLVPYLNDIVQTLAKAFQYYQAKNLLILYDAVGTLANAVGPELDAPQFKEALLRPLVQKLEATPDNDRSITALFECLSSMAQNLGPSFLPLCAPLVDRCVRIIMNGAQAAQMWQQNPNEFEKPDREVVSASIDLLSGMVEGLQGRISEVLQQKNFLSVVPEVLKDSALQVKQSAFALVGDSAKYCIEHLAPFLPVLLPQCAKALRESNSAQVSNNASWAIGEICIKVGAEYMQTYLDDIVGALVAALHRPQASRQQLLMSNVCITLGRLAMVCGAQMGKLFGDFARTWCLVMKDTRQDAEKINAFQGLLNMVRANPQVGMTCPAEFLGAISSLCPPPENMKTQLAEIVSSYKQQLGANYVTVWNQMPLDCRQRLQGLYAAQP
eukprot:TRINITY_DN76332_c0_g1_i1.p1 TRINITY_DN76332_c0_g1~~TRINITY_DN76332_c0_g1_i1.p1  ORF type:complete len:910 (-),score=193.42 TRINITY_DN76332_c0_g1_i1:79-2808(-)